MFALNPMNTTDYTAQAETFLTRNGIKFRATLSDSKTPAWDGPHGHHYRVTLSKNRPIYRLYEEIAEMPNQSYRFTFDFWGSEKASDDLKRHTELSDKISRHERELSGACGQNAANIRAFVEGLKERQATLQPHPSAYDVLACISSDAGCPDTFEDYCAEYGADSDSIRDLQTFRRCSRFAKRLREFFTETELEELSEIQ